MVARRPESRQSLDEGIEPKPARATERAALAAVTTITVPATFQPNVRYSNWKLRRKTPVRVVSGGSTAHPPG